MKKIDVILLSFNDNRIINAINSIKNNPTSDIVRLIIIDGGSESEILHLINTSIASSDILISENDNGIFDALNKGLDLCTSEHIGWLGSDDYFSREIDFNNIAYALKTNDLYIGKIAYLSKLNVITRIIETWPLKFGLIWYCFNSPHFSTFGNKDILKKFRFLTTIRGADIEYFLKVFSESNNIYFDDRVITYMSEGGFSNSSFLSVLKARYELFQVYNQYIPSILVPFFMFLKLSYSLLNNCIHRFRGKKIYYEA